MKPKKGFELSSLAGIGITFVVVAIVLSFGSTILGELRDDAEAKGDNTTAYNATTAGLEGLTEFADWLPTLALIIVAAVIIGIIVKYFAFGGA